jgi:hypothetical protein
MTSIDLPREQTGLREDAGAIICPYHPEYCKGLAAVGLFLGFAYFSANLAYFNDRGMILNGIVHLSPQNATVFLWVVCGLFGLLVVYATVVTTRYLMVSPHVLLSDTEIVIPLVFSGFRTTSSPLWQCEYVKLKFSDIALVQTKTIKQYNQKRIYIYLYTGGGMKYELVGSCFKRDHLRKVLMALQSRQLVGVLIT